MKISTNTIAEVQAAVSQPFPKFSVSAKEAYEIDAIGSRLWNAATKVLREHVGEDSAIQGSSSDKFVASLRAFAFLLIDKARRTAANRKDLSEQVRIFKLALKASRLCLEKSALDCASIVLERCAEYASSAEDASPINFTTREDTADESGILRELVVEYYMLRMSHAWKSGRLDTAEHFFRKIEKRSLAESVACAESCTELCLEIGKTLTKQKRPDVAVSWLERGVEVLDLYTDQSLEAVSEDLRLAVVAAAVEALCRQQSSSAYERAYSLVDNLKSEYGLGNRVAVSAIELKLGLQAMPPDSDALSSVLARMVQGTILTDATFRLQVHKTFALS